LISSTDGNTKFVCVLARYGGPPRYVFQNTTNDVFIVIWHPGIDAVIEMVVHATRWERAISYLGPGMYNYSLTPSFGSLDTYHQMYCARRDCAICGQPAEHFGFKGEYSLCSSHYSDEFYPYDEFGEDYYGES
jgi:hypothetical protein